MARTGWGAAPTPALPWAGQHYGTWVCDTPQGPAELTLYRDNMSMTFMGRQGNYLLAGGSLMVTLGGTTVTYSVAFDGTQAVLSGGDLGGKTLAFRRKGAPVQGATREAGPKLPPFEARRTQGFTFASPRGWTVTPMQGGFFIPEKPPPALGAGIVLMGGQAPPAAADAQAVAAMALQALRASLADLAVVEQDSHPQQPDLFRSKIRYAQNTVPFEGVSYSALQQGRYLFALFTVPGVRAAEFDADAMLAATLTPGSAPQPTPPPAPAPTRTQDDITDPWFLPEGRTLRGFYGGAIWREKLASHMSTGTGIPGQPGYGRADTVQTGGDFRVAFYTDGSVRAKVIMANYGPLVSYDVPFQYEGTYVLRPDGGLQTSAMPLTNTPQTYIKSERRMARLQLAGRYDKGADTFALEVSFYNPQQSAWDRKGLRTLAAATSRKTYGFSTQTTPHGTTSAGAGP